MTRYFPFLLLASICLCCLFLPGCQKNTQWQYTSTPQPLPTEQLLQKINARYPSLSTAEINNIESVTTYSYNGHTYTHITFYTHNNQLQSMVIDSYYTTAGNILETTYRCDSNFCTCQIVIEQSEKGEVTIRCSCTPCTMTIQ